MTDEAVSREPSAREKWTWGVALGLSSWVFSVALIVSLVVYGNSANALHTFAMTGAWGLLFGVPAAFGLTAISPLLPWTAK